MAVCMHSNRTSVAVDFSSLTMRDSAPVVTMTEHSTSPSSSQGSGQDEEGGLRKPQVTLRILNRGPDYFRNRVLNRRSSAEKAERRKSAVELLQETKSQFYGQSTDSFYANEHQPNLSQSPCKTHQFMAEISGRQADKTEESLSQDVDPSDKKLSSTCAVQSGIEKIRRRKYSKESSNPHNGGNSSLSDCGDVSGRLTSMSNSEMSQSNHADTRPIRNTSHVATCMASLSVNQSDAQHSSPRPGCHDGSSSSAVRNNLDVMSVHAADLHWDLDRCSDSAIGTDNTFGTVESSVVVRKRSKRSSVHRSRSDLSHRYSNSSDLSELSAHLSRHSQDFDRMSSRNSHDLERFFNEMGLEKGVLDPINVSHLQSLGVFDSVSSLDTADNISIYGRRSDCAAKTDESDQKSSQTSIVERNARIIKWLCSVKRAKSTDQ